MSFANQATAHFLRRRQVLRGVIAAAAGSFGTLSCATQKQKPLQVGGLPVTCNLTLPVACVAKAAQQRRRPGRRQRFEFEYSKYNGWPEIKESLMAGRIQAAYMLAPLVMDLADKQHPGQDRLARPPLGRGDHGAHAIRRTSTSSSSTGKRVAFPAASPSTSCSCARCSRRKA